MNRGDKNGVVFRDDVDRARFIDTLGETCSKTQWKVHAFVLIPNHFHLLIQTPEPNLIDGMKWMLGTYTIRFNVRHNQRGHLFAGRYRAQCISPQPHFLGAVMDYIHLNPARAQLVTPEQPLREYRWSSLPCFLGVVPTSSWLRDAVPGADTLIPAQAEARLEQLRGEAEPDFESIRSGWYLGDESYRQSLLHRVNQTAGTHHTGVEIAAAAEARAEELIAGFLVRLAWSEKELQSRPKGDLEKVALAELLRRESTMTLRWIATRLSMGTPGHLSHLLYWRRRGIRPFPRRAKSLLPTPSVSSISLAPTVAESSVVESSPFSFDTSYD